MKQVYKGTIVTLNKAVKNIIETYGISDTFAGNDWYVEANQYAQSLSRTFNVPLSVSCGVIAALSPIKRWEENKTCAYSFFDKGRAQHTKLFAGKAKQIKGSNGEVDEISTILNGRKIISFFLNILNPEQTTSVTIDRHALSIILGRSVKDGEYRGMTVKQYEFFVMCYQVAGAKLGISPVIVQSISWQNWREAKGIVEKADEVNDDVPF